MYTYRVTVECRNAEKKILHSWNVQAKDCAFAAYFGIEHARIRYKDEFSEYETVQAQKINLENIENNPYAEEGAIECQYCGSGEWLYNEDGAPNEYCGQCGHLIDWPEASEEAAARRRKND